MLPGFGSGRWPSSLPLTLRRRRWCQHLSRRTYPRTTDDSARDSRPKEPNTRPTRDMMLWRRPCRAARRRDRWPHTTAPRLVTSRNHNSPSTRLAIASPSRRATVTAVAPACRPSRSGPRPASASREPPRAPCRERAPVRRGRQRLAARPTRPPRNPGGHRCGDTGPTHPPSHRTERSHRRGDTPFHRVKACVKLAVSA